MDETLRDLLDRLLALIYEDEYAVPLIVMSAADDLREYLEGIEE